MGEATAELFAVEDAKVAVIDIQVDRGQQVVDKILSLGGQVIYLFADGL